MLILCPGLTSFPRRVRLSLARLCFRSQVKGETERERLLLAYQVNDEVQQGHFPVNKELALEVAALMAQVWSIERKLLIVSTIYCFLLFTLLWLSFFFFLYFLSFISANFVVSLFTFQSKCKENNTRKKRNNHSFFYVFLFEFPSQVEHSDLEKPASFSPSGSSQPKAQLILLQALDRFYPKRYKQDCSPEQLR